MKTGWVDQIIDRCKQRFLDWLAFFIGSKIGQKLPKRMVEGMASTLPDAVVQRQPIQISAKLTYHKQQAKARAKMVSVQANHARR
jgi:hypothetical protein